MSLKVLIVDDDFINRKLILTLLKKHPDIVGEIIEAENGSEALGAIKADPGIGLILLDIMMPVLDGREFLKIFRSEKDKSSIPVIVLSTDDTQKGIVFEYGADDFLTKPIKENELITTMKKWIH